MSRLIIEINHNQEAFSPDDTIKGKVSWELSKQPESVFLRLFWYTKGKGTEDIDVVSEISFDYPHPKETRPFEIKLPISPYSFSGKLVSLIWALELVTDNPDAAIQKEIVIAPYGQEINLLTPLSTT